MYEPHGEGTSAASIRSRRTHQSPKTAIQHVLPLRLDLGAIYKVFVGFGGYVEVQPAGRDIPGRAIFVVYVGCEGSFAVVDAPSLLVGVLVARDVEGISELARLVEVDDERIRV